MKSKDLRNYICYARFEPIAMLSLGRAATVGESAQPI